MSEIWKQVKNRLAATGDGFEVSYFPGPRADDFDLEDDHDAEATTLHRFPEPGASEIKHYSFTNKDGPFYELIGDHREGYTPLIDLGFAA